MMTKKRTPGAKFINELSWEEKAKQNPLYGVMSVDDFACAGPEPTSDQIELFFSDGESKVRQWLLPWLQATDTNPHATILEFGCGMGRLLRALRSSYPNVAGVDVSPSMVAHAAKYLPDLTIKVIAADGTIPFATASVDRVYSYAVFQHVIHWSTIKKAIAEIGRVLKPGGKAKVQFDMVFPPEFMRSGGLPRRTYALEQQSIIYGWTRRFGLPIPAARLLSHNHWVGARPSYRQLIGELRSHGLHVHGIEHILNAPHLVWFLLRKHESNG